MPERRVALPREVAAIAARRCEVYGLDVYGVDMIDAGGGTPLIVEVNAFPGARPAGRARRSPRWRCAPPRRARRGSGPGGALGGERPLAQGA
ncbi:hypothetical protein [Streptomyces tremellae]|uniref:ATP-grasp fold RimK-type domain-containing protein n=1 Tax=Streptomyces tremellae TaxID=1124239 RepID=A0ABP7EVU0_9ACTN